MNIILGPVITEKSVTTPKIDFFIPYFPLCFLLYPNRWRASAERLNACPT